MKHKVGFYFVNNLKLIHFYNFSFFKASYKVVIHVGDIGSAMVVKVASNMLCCVNVLGMQEALMLG